MITEKGIGEDGAEQEIQYSLVLAVFRSETRKTTVVSENEGGARPK